MRRLQSEINTKPIVSIVIPAFNCAKHIKGSLDSVLKQDFQKIEIICVDDGSTDNTPEILRVYAKRLRGKMKVISQPNSGPAAARNNGVKHSKGRYIAFLDSDDAWLPQKLSKQVSRFEADKDIALIHTDFLYVYDNTEEKKSEFSSSEKKFFSGNAFFELFKKNFILTSSVLVRKKVFEEAGMMNEAFKMSEDYELWLRIAEKHKIDYIDIALVKYRKHELSMTKGNIEETYYWVEKAAQEIMASFPGKSVKLKELLRYRRAKNYFTMGYHFMLRNDTVKARENFQNSLKNRISRKALTYYLLTLLPPGFGGLVRGVKKLVNKK